MLTPQARMRWIDAESVQERDILLKDGILIRVVKIERPYAVVRRYHDSEFGDRRVITLEGKYFVPTRDFLNEAGVYNSRLLTEEVQEISGDFVLDVSDLTIGPEDLDF